jgi:hypothetical protein
LKNTKIAAKAQKKAEKEARKVKGEAYIAQLEVVEDANIANTDSEFPRHRRREFL